MTAEKYPVSITCFDCGRLWIEMCLCNVLYGNGWLVTYSDRTVEKIEKEQL